MLLVVGCGIQVTKPSSAPLACSATAQLNVLVGSRKRLNAAAVTSSATVRSLWTGGQRCSSVHTAEHGLELVVQLPEPAPRRLVARLDDADRDLRRRIGHVYRLAEVVVARSGTPLSAVPARAARAEA